jgi:hypothetical protein
MITLFGISRFEQQVLSMALVHLCDRHSPVNQRTQQDDSATAHDAGSTPWLGLQQFTLYIPHPEQQYEGISLEAGLTQGLNIEVQPVQNREGIPYAIPTGSHFVRILRQKALDRGFGLMAVGLFIPPMALLKLDLIVDAEQAEYQAIAVRHPVLRDYPKDWEQRLNVFLQQDRAIETLPNLIGYVDRGVNQDYTPPTWNQLYPA